MHMLQPFRTGIAARRVLHLVGSPTSDFHRELSELYAGGCLAALDDDARLASTIAHVCPDGTWRFPASLSPRDIAAAPGLDIAQAMREIAGRDLEVALPQMFCRAGMTDYRALLEVLGLPYLGNRPLQMALCADKAKTKAIVAAAGVAVPHSRQYVAGERPALSLPAIVKPNDADNSDGVTLLRSAAGYGDAARRALEFSDTLLVEQYIEAGREVRCAVVERGARLQCLPLEEYRIHPEQRPVRVREHKLGRTDGGSLALTSKGAAESWIVAADDPIVERVHAAARACHEALGCRQYSLFDFRIDPDGKPWFLEAGLYCSFAPNSVVVTMMAAAGTPLNAFLAGAIDALLDDRRSVRAA